MRVIILPIATIFFLAGCHADVTLRFDVRGDGNALVTVYEIIDDQLYNLAVSESTNGDPFGMERMQHKGWAVSSASDNAGSHIIAMSRVISRADLQDISRTAPVLRGASVPFGPIAFSRSSGLFYERDSLSATIPALLPLALSTIGKFYADAASPIVASAVDLHLELRTPGKVLATNGKIMPDGFVRWNLDLQAPTKVQYTARMINITNALMALIIITLTLTLVVTVGGLQKKFAVPTRRRSRNGQAP
jgi:hypothetical protein